MKNNKNADQHLEIGASSIGTLNLFPIFNNLPQIYVGPQVDNDKEEQLIHYRLTFLQHCPVSRPLPNVAVDVVAVVVDVVVVELVVVVPDSKDGTQFAN